MWVAKAQHTLAQQMMSRPVLDHMTEGACVRMYVFVSSTSDRMPLIAQPQ